MKAFKENEQKIRCWLVRAIWALAGITLLGITLGGVLLSRIGGLSGWRSFGAGKEEHPIYTQEQIDKFITGVLITVQNQPMDHENAPADMVFIASFNALKQELSLVAFMSGTLVEAEGYGQKTLAETYALGGPGLLINSVNEAFGLDLQSYACTDAHSLAAMIDLLGGVQADLTREEAAYINDALGEAGGVTPGALTLTGTQCMVHALNEISGDLPQDGIRRRLDLVDSAVSNMRKTATKDAMLPLLALVFSNIQTNLDLMTLKNFGYEILKAEEMEYQSLALPWEGSWKSVMEQGQEAIQADLPKNAALLREKLYNVE